MSEVVTNAEGQRGWYEPIWGTWHDEYVPDRLEDGSINPAASDEDREYDYNYDEMIAHDNYAQTLTVAERQTLAPYQPKPLSAFEPGVIGGLTLNQINPPIIAPIQPIVNPAPVTVTPAQPTMNENGHTYIGKDSTGLYDTYYLIDEGGDKIQWLVPAGADSRAVIGGTIQNLGHNYPGATGTPTNSVPVSQPSVTSPNFNPTHKLVGKDAFGNSVYQLTDEGGTVVEWAVRPGDASTVIVPGSVRNISGNDASPSQVVSAGIANNTTGVVNTTGARPNDTHQFIGKDGAGNSIYQLIDAGGNTIQWKVRPGEPSANAIPGSVVRVTGLNAAPPITVVSIGSPTGGNGTSTGNVQDGNAGVGGPGTGTVGTTSTTNTRKGDPTHVLVGRDSKGNNVYHLTDDGGDVIEWAVKPGDDTRNAIAGSIRNITQGQATQVDPAYVGSPSQPATGFDTSNIAKLGVAALIAYFAS